jgi:hypothetical protein
MSFIAATGLTNVAESGNLAQSVARANLVRR